jgi:hypothetical protein
VEDTFRESRTETVTSLGLPPSVLGKGWPSASNPQTPSVPVNRSLQVRQVLPQGPEFYVKAAASAFVARSPPPRSGLSPRVDDGNR